MNKNIHIVILLMLTACQTGTGQIGENYISVAPSSESLEITKLKKWQEPSYYFSSSIEKDIEKVQARGYVILGSSRFNDTEFSFGHAANHAYRVGATHIIYTEQNNFPDISKLSNKMISRKTPVYLGLASAPPLSGVDIDNIMTSGNDNNSSTYQHYDYGSTYSPVIMRHFESYFFAKSIDHHVNFGITLENRHSSGVRISNVNANSVGARVGLHENDILISVNGTDIRNSGDALSIFEDIDELSEQTSLFVMRNDTRLIVLIPPVFAN